MNIPKGLTLLEALLTLSIIGILLSLAVPSFLQIQKSTQLKGALESSYFAFQHARSAAISMGKNVGLFVISGKHWCFGLSATGPCDCNKAHSCALNTVEYAIRASDFRHVSLQDLKFGADKMATFDGVRGLSVGSAGSVVFSDGSNQVKLILSNMGRVCICVLEGQLGRYPRC